MPRRRPGPPPLLFLLRLLLAAPLAAEGTGFPISSDSACTGMVPLTLDVVMDDWVPYAYYSTTPVSGYSVDVLQRVAEHGEFTFTVRSQYENNLQAAINDSADLIGTYWQIVPSRVSYAFPTVPYVVASYYVITLTPTAVAETFADQMMNFTKPFSAGLWAALVAVLIVSALALNVVERGFGFQRHCCDDSEHGEFTGLSVKRSVCDAVFLSFTQYTTGGGFDPKTVCGRVVHVSLTFLILVSTAAYTANMAADLTAKAGEMQRITDGADFEKKGLPYCTDGMWPDDFSGLNIIRSKYPGTPSFVIWKNKTAYDDMKKAERYAKRFKHMLDGDCYGFLDSSSDIMRTPFVLEDPAQGGTPEIVETYCQFETVGQSILNRMGAYFVDGPYKVDGTAHTAAENARKACVLSRVNYGISRVVSDVSVLEGLTQKWFKKRNCAAAGGGVEGAAGLTTQQFGGIFILHGSIMVLGVAVTLGYYFSHGHRDDRSDDDLSPTGAEPAATSPSGLASGALIPEEIMEAFEVAGEGTWRQFFKLCKGGEGLKRLHSAGGPLAVRDMAREFLVASCGAPTAKDAYTFTMAGALLADWCQRADQQRAAAAQPGDAGGKADGAAGDMSVAPLTEEEPSPRRYSGSGAHHAATPKPTMASIDDLNLPDS